MDIIGRYLHVRGHRLYFDTAGPKAGQPVVLIHTAGQHALQWRFVIPELAESGYLVVAPDLPGHGKSLLAGFEPLVRIHDMAEVVWELIGKLDLGRPAVVGCSIGGDITLDLLVNHSSKMFAGVVCQAAGRTPTIPDKMIKRGLNESATPSFSDQAALTALSACGTKAAPERIPEIVFTRRAGDPRIYYSDLQAWISHDVTTRLGQVNCPVLCLWGNEDYFVPFHLVEETVKAIPNCELKILEGIGHYPHIESPSFALIVHEFLSKHKNKGAAK